MNAKKIMGAVLVALLAAALFVGAGAAAATPTVFVYQQTTYNGVFTTEDGKNTIMFVNGYVSGDNIVEGLYTNNGGTDYIYVMYPDAKITATYQGASFIGGTVPSGAVTNQNFTATSYVSAVPATLVFINPDGVKTTEFTGEAGEWKVMGKFSNLVAGTPSQYTFGKTVYTFTVIDTDAAITISADSVIKGNTFFVTITGVPGKDVTLKADKAGLHTIAGQLSVTPNTSVDILLSEVTFKLPDSGKKQIALYSPVADGKFTITAKVDTETVTAKVTILKGEITVESAEDFYYLGTDVVLSGTNTESKKVYFYIKGSNVAFQTLNNTNGQITANVKSDKTWEIEIKGDVFKNFDAGTYTIYAVADEVQTKLSDYTYASVSVALKQPFLTAELSSTTVAQGSELVITGTAEAATEGLLIYVFGNNKFTYDNITVEDDGTYEFELDIEEDKYATGQYFVVIQHPMYDKNFNIAPVLATGDAVGQKLSFNIELNTENNVQTATTGNSILFNTLERQSSNAAEALCQALDTQNIDDIYVKATFVVAQPTATINPVDDVAKGAKLVVSGTSNMAPGTVVTVEMLSTAFAAIPKESVNSASFITLTTKVQDDGTWEVTFDTSGLNVDEYTLGATVGDIKTSTVVVKVLESAPVTPPGDDKPDTPVTPPTDDPKPTEPTTPGFGALAALAGLGAVAVLLLRRE